ncbi:dephospho-CoA kinase [Salana multivorans]
MLLVGLTGGMAAGKSTIARRLAEHGAVVVDADRLAREVVEPGTPGLAAVVARFGPEVLTAEGALDRGHLASLVFDDDAARADLESIIHPAVAQAFEDRVAELTRSRPDAIVVHDVPLLVENGLAPRYHLVVVADAPESVRLDRAVRERGMDPEAARARIAAQANDDERRAVADVLIDTDCPPEETLAAVDALWHDRLVPYERNVREGRRAPRPVAALVEDDVADPWAQQAQRVLARLRRAGGHLVQNADHIGSTAVPGLQAKDVVDVQIGVASLEDAAALAPALTAAGFPLAQAQARDVPKPSAAEAASAEQWRKTLHGSADPDRPVNLHVRVTGSPGWCWALAFRDWLRADPAARQRYQDMKAEALERVADQLDGHPTAAYADAKEPYFAAVDEELAAWRRRADWLLHRDG